MSTLSLQSIAEALEAAATFLSDSGGDTVADVLVEAGASEPELEYLALKRLNALGIEPETAEAYFRREGNRPEFLAWAIVSKQSRVITSVQDWACAELNRRGWTTQYDDQPSAVLSRILLSEMA